jgi:single-strand DNA-binding protein
MIGVNKVILLGNLAKNPDVVAFPQNKNNGTAGVVKKASFPVMTTEYRRNRDGEKTEHSERHNVVCWYSLAEIAEKILRKGSLIYVEGKLQTRSWEDKEGNKHYITEVIADSFNVIANRNRPEETPAPEPDPLSNILNDETEPLGDLPF